MLFKIKHVNLRLFITYEQNVQKNQRTTEKMFCYQKRKRKFRNKKTFGVKFFIESEMI